MLFYWEEWIVPFLLLFSSPPNKSCSDSSLSPQLISSTFGKLQVWIMLELGLDSTELTCEFCWRLHPSFSLCVGINFLSLSAYFPHQLLLPRIPLLPPLLLSSSAKLPLPLLIISYFGSLIFRLIQLSRFQRPHWPRGCVHLSKTHRAATQKRNLVRTGPKEAYRTQLSPRVPPSRKGSSRTPSLFPAGRLNLVWIRLVSLYHFSLWKIGNPFPTFLTPGFPSI